MLQCRPAQAQAGQKDPARRSLTRGQRQKIQRSREKMVKFLPVPGLCPTHSISVSWPEPVQGATTIHSCGASEKHQVSVFVINECLHVLLFKIFEMISPDYKYLWPRSGGRQYKSDAGLLRARAAGSLRPLGPDCRSPLPGWRTVTEVCVGLSAVSAGSDAGHCRGPGDPDAPGLQLQRRSLAPLAALRLTLARLPHSPLAHSASQPAWPASPGGPRQRLPRLTVSSHRPPSLQHPPPGPPGHGAEV